MVHRRPWGGRPGKTEKAFLLAVEKAALASTHTHTHTHRHTELYMHSTHRCTHMHSPQAHTLPFSEVIEL
jgi:hypothetical protein